MTRSDRLWFYTAIIILALLNAGLDRAFDNHWIKVETPHASGFAL